MLFSKNYLCAVLLTVMVIDEFDAMNNLENGMNLAKNS